MHSKRRIKTPYQIARALLTWAILLMAFFVHINVFAAEPIREGKFETLTEEEKEAAVRSLVKKIRSDLSVTTKIDVVFYEDKDDIQLAYNTVTVTNSGVSPSVINVNKALLFSQEEALIKGLIIEQNIVQCMAHEVRHTYQAEASFTDTEYGNKCRESFLGYVEYKDSIEGYYENFVEQDADDFGTGYMKRYFASGGGEEITITIEHPFADSVYASLPQRQRDLAVRVLAEFVSRKLGIQTPAVVWESQGQAVVYNRERDALILDPLISVRGSSLADMITHETRHAFQYAHKNDDGEYGTLIREGGSNYMEADAAYFLDEFHKIYGHPEGLYMPIRFSSNGTGKKKPGTDTLSEAGYFKKEALLERYNNLLFEKPKKDSKAPEKAERSGEPIEEVIDGKFDLPENAVQQENNEGVQKSFDWRIIILAAIILIASTAAGILLHKKYCYRRIKELCGEIRWMTPKRFFIAEQRLGRKDSFKGIALINIDGRVYTKRCDDLFEEISPVVPKIIKRAQNRQSVRIGFLLYSDCPSISADKILRIIGEMYGTGVSAG